MADEPIIDELCQRARKYLKTGRVREALAVFEEARQLNDLDPDVHYGLATAHCLLDAFESSAKHFELVTRLDPRRSAAWINLGAVYNRLGNFSKAVEVLRRAVQIDRKSSAGFYNLGFAYRRLKQWALAVPAYREAIRIDPQMADAYLNLGKVYLEMGNMPQAAAQFKKALDLQPDLERARRGLEQAQVQLKSDHDARSPFGPLVNLDDSAQIDVNAAMQGRELTDSERAIDRREIFKLLTQAATDLQEVMTCLEKQINPTLRTLNRLLTHRSSPHGETLTRTEAFEHFQEARTAFEPRLKQIRRVVQQLRDHEASVK
ncbi:MAG: tetratricopeptide repeat protein [Planctomycetaceae bacterium]|nr:tetratricopeptide repeat protein [Planctomycetaceae bacterium]